MVDFVHDATKIVRSQLSIFNGSFHIEVRVFTDDNDKRPIAGLSYFAQDKAALQPIIDAFPYADAHIPTTSSTIHNVTSSEVVVKDDGRRIKIMGKADSFNRFVTTIFKMLPDQGDDSTG